MMRAVPGPNKIRIALAGIFVLAISLRLIYLYQLKLTRIFGLFAMDSFYFDKFALKILGGNFTYPETIYLHPLYPFILALIYKIFGHKLFAVGLFQAVVDSVACILIYFASVKMFNKKAVGLAAAFLYACYAMAIFYTGFLMDTTVFTFLMVCLLLALLYAKDKAHPLLWLVSGIIGALAVLLKSIPILLFLILLPWICLQKDLTIKKKRSALILISAGLLLILFPFSLRNYIIEKRFSPFSVQGGKDFYIGNHLGATGTHVSLAGISDSPVDETKESIIEAERQTGKQLSSSQAAGYWFSKGIGFVIGHPRQYLILTCRKFLLFMNAKEIAANVNFYFCKRFLPFFDVPLFSFGIIAPFTVLGAAFAVKRKEKKAYLVFLFIFTYMASLMMFFVSSHYRFGAAPFMIILAAYGAYNFVLLIRRLEIRKIALCSALLLTIIFITNLNMAAIDSANSFATPYNNLGAVYQGQDAMEKAVAEYRQAIKVNPRYANAYHNLGALYYRIGNEEKAARYFKKAIRLNPDFAKAYFGLANIYADADKYEEAANLYEKVIELNPYFVEAYNNLGRSYYRLGLIDRSIEALKKAIEIEPGYAKSYNNLGALYAETGRRKEAIALFEKAIKIDPNYIDAYKNLSIAYYHDKK